MQLKVGDPVRIRVTPEIDETLWDTMGLIAALGPDGRVTVELDDGADCTCLLDQLDPVDPDVERLGPPHFL